MTRRFENFANRLEGRAAQQDAKADEPDAPDPENPEEPAPEPEPDPEDQTDKEDETMSDLKPLEEREDYQAGVAAGRKAANERMNAVFASEHFDGREAAAAKLLGKPSMSAEDIGDVLADMPKREQATALTEEQQREAAEEGGRKEMRESMKASGNVDLGADAEPKPASASDRILAAQAKATGRKPRS